MAARVQRRLRDCPSVRIAAEARAWLDQAPGKQLWACPHRFSMRRLVPCASCQSSATAAGRSEPSCCGQVVAEHRQARCGANGSAWRRRTPGELSGARYPDGCRSREKPSVLPGPTAQSQRRSPASALPGAPAVGAQQHEIPQGPRLRASHPRGLGKMQCLRFNSRLGRSWEVGSQQRNRSSHAVGTGLGPAAVPRPQDRVDGRLRDACRRRNNGRPPPALTRVAPRRYRRNCQREFGNVSFREQGLGLDQRVHSGWTLPPRTGQNMDSSERSPACWKCSPIWAASCDRLGDSCSNTGLSVNLLSFPTQGREQAVTCIRLCRKTNAAFVFRPGERPALRDL
jgi:hypothetical protein